MLRLVAIRAGWYCFPWRLRMRLEPEHGGDCCYCGREIAVPDKKRGWHCACIYCGLERGELPKTEAEAYGTKIPITACIFETQIG